MIDSGFENRIISSSIHPYNLLVLFWSLNNKFNLNEYPSLKFIFNPTCSSSPKISKTPPNVF